MPFLLDLVKKALPKGSFVVVFGDTGMEFPDTYDVIEKLAKLVGRRNPVLYCEITLRSETAGSCRTP